MPRQRSARLLPLRLPVRTVQPSRGPSLLPAVHVYPCPCPEATHTHATDRVQPPVMRRPRRDVPCPQSEWSLWALPKRGRCQMPVHRAPALPVRTLVPCLSVLSLPPRGSPSLHHRLYPLCLRPKDDSCGAIQYRPRPYPFRGCRSILHFPLCVTSDVPR